MGESLQDQLLKAGLANEKQAKNARKEKRVSRKNKKGKKKQQEQKAPEENSIAREERLAYEARNRELNRQRNEEKKQRENAAQIRQIVLKNKVVLEPRDDDEPYHYVVKKRIKKFFMPAKLADQVSNGGMAIVNLDGQFELIPADAARKIAQRNPKCLVVFHEEPENEDNG